MTREKHIREIVEGWKRHIPPDGVEIETVWKVAVEYFPQSEKKRGRGSHLYFVRWNDHEELAKLNGLPNLPPFERDNSFLLPLKSGRWIKKPYIKKLLKAIELREEYYEKGAKQS